MPLRAAPLGCARVKSGFDNHLEGSSIERYSQIAETMPNLRGQGGASDAPMRRD
jgi:hypothetical protein